jgi:ribosomal protein L29
MVFSKYKELNHTSTLSDIDQEIFLLQKSLVELKLNTATRKSFQFHLYKHTKRRIAQLKFQRSSLIRNL